MDLSVIPNLITLMRLLLVVPVAVAILSGHFILALMLFAIASISDGADGYLARRYHWASRFGAILDPIADKLMLIVAFLLLTYIGELPTWLAAVVIGRDLIIVAGAAIYHILFGEYELSPTLLGKLSTAAQFILVLLSLVDLALFQLNSLLLVGSVWIVFIISSVSGLDYCLTWGKKALAANRRKSST